MQKCFQLNRSCFVISVAQLLRYVGAPRLFAHFTTLILPPERVTIHKRSGDKRTEAGDNPMSLNGIDVTMQCKTSLECVAPTPFLLWWQHALERTYGTTQCACSITFLVHNKWTESHSVLQTDLTQNQPPNHDSTTTKKL